MIKLFKILNRNQKNRLLIIFISMTLVSIFETFSIGSLLPLLNSVFTNSFDDTFFSKYISFLEGKFSNNYIHISLLIILITFCLKNLLIFAHTKFVSSFMFYLSLDLQRKTFESYINKKYIEIKDEDSSKILRDIDQESKMLSSTFVSPMLTLLLNLTTVLFILFFLLIYNFKITLVITLILGLFLIIFNYFFKKKLETLGQLRQNSAKDLIKTIKETFNGFKELKIYNKLDLFMHNFRKKSIKLASIGITRSVISVAPKLISELIIILIIVIAIFLSTQSGSSINKSLAVISVYAIAGFRLLPSFISLILNYQKMNFSNAVINLMFELLDHKSQKSEKHDIKKINFTNQIEFKNVDFNFKDKIVFKNLNIRILKNSFIGIKGLSGSGKSTFVDLLTGILKPKSGKILIDSHEIHDYNSRIDLFSYVQQKVHIFDANIIKNISFKDEINKDETKKLFEIIKFCELSNFIENLPNNIETDLQEFGRNLSGGQAQRIGLARALYKNSEIIVIDEGLNNLDEVTKNLILDKFIELKETRTIVYVSHDSKDLEKCDSVISI